MTIKSILLISLIGFLAGCASTSPLNSCSDIDWYEVGRQEGAQGLEMKNNLNDFKHCSAPQEAFNIYGEGRNAGLAEFCTEDNGYQIGKTIGYYKPGYCPPFLEAKFLAARNQGEKVAQLEKTIQDIDRRIIALQSETNREPSALKDKSQLKVLKQAKRKNEDLMKELIR